MKLLPITTEISEKLRELVKLRFTTRGKFKELELASGISASKWKNFYYGSQEATQELLNFWTQNYADSIYNENETYVDILPNDEGISERLRDLVKQRFQTRTPIEIFRHLESISGIDASKWKGVFYRKQKATQEMLHFWCNQYKESKHWLLTGEFSENEIYPFGTPAPKVLPSEKLSINDRLMWVIKEYAAPPGEHLFVYLSERRRGLNISAEEWRQVLQEKVEPNLKMIQVACEMYPGLTQWIVTGSVSPEPQIDPTDKSSILRWAEYRTKKGSESDLYPRS